MRLVNRIPARHAYIGTFAPKVYAPVSPLDASPEKPSAARVAEIPTDQHARVDVKCVFLDDGLCMVHDVRPIPCLSWCSLSRVKCEAASKADPATAKVPIDPNLHAARGGTQAGLCVGAARSGLHGGVCELHSALLRALDTPDAGERWARGEKVFADCRVPVEYCGPGLPLPVLRQ